MVFDFNMTTAAILIKTLFSSRVIQEYIVQGYDSSNAMNISPKAVIFLF